MVVAEITRFQIKRTLEVGTRILEVTNDDANMLNTNDGHGQFWFPLLWIVPVLPRQSRSDDHFLKRSRRESEKVTGNS